LQGCAIAIIKDIRKGDEVLTDSKLAKARLKIAAPLPNPR
jgi:hypothetical protein